MVISGKTIDLIVTTFISKIEFGSIICITTVQV